jgi:Holliday junction resolvase RusA-like endonuclease
MITFTIPGRPYAKKRPRFSRKNGRAFDPKENGQYESTVASIALPHFPQPITGPVKLTINVIFATAASWSKKKTAATIHTPHLQKPDVDNLAKAIADSLNRIAWCDDSQIYELSVCKFWGLRDETHVFVEQSE